MPVTAPAIAGPPARSLASRAWGAGLAVWAAFTGILPHVLHHVGPLAGAALLAGAAGTAVFAAIALVASVPFLLRMYRRFGTWVAPAAALGVMAVAFSVSSFVIGPAVTGGDESRPQPAGHDAHH